MNLYQLRSRSIPIAVLATLVAPTAARADQGSGSFSGRVVDGQTGAPIADAVVVATSNSLQGEQTVTTDASGYYRIPHLPAGIYTLQYFGGKYQPGSRENIRLSAGAQLRADLRLVPEGQVVTEISVERPVIDATSSANQTNVSQELLRSVPLVAPGAGGGAVRSFEAVAAVAPGARPDAFGVSLGGTTSPENSYVVNGVNTGNTAVGTNASPLSSEFLQEVQILTGAYMPEFGMNTGGTISAVVKQGSNEFHGHSWATFSPGALNGSSKQVERESSTIGQRAATVWVGDVGSDVGGPIIKDKLWFYTGLMFGQTRVELHRWLNQFEIDEDKGQYVRDDRGFRKKSELDGSQSTYAARGSTVQAVARLNLRISDDQQLDAMVSVLPTWAGSATELPADARNGTAASPLNGSLDTLSTRRRQIPVDFILKWIADADNKRWNFETSVGLHYERSQILAADGTGPGDMSRGLASRPLVIWQRNTPYHSITDFEKLPASVDKHACDSWQDPDAPDDLTRSLPRCPVDTYVTGGPGAMRDQKQHSLQLRHVTTRFANFLGHHEVKAGATYSLATFDNLRGQSGGVVYRESTSGRSVSDVFQYGYLKGADDPVYLQSYHWTTKMHTGRAFLQDQWTIAEKITLNLGVLYDAQRVVNGFGENVATLSKQFSPRVGFSWVPFKKGTLKVRGNWGRYFQALTLQLADRAGTPESHVLAVHQANSCDFRDLEQACRDPDSYWPGRTSEDASIPSKSFHRLGAARTPIDPSLRAQAKDEFSFGTQWEFLPTYSLSLDYTHSQIVRVIEDMSRNEGATYFIGNPGEGIASDFPKAQRRYDALAVSLNKAFGNHFTILANYSLQRLYGNYNGLFRPETNQLDPNITADFDLRSLLDNRTGPLDGDVRHQFKVFGGGMIPLNESWGIDVGGSFTAFSGRPSNVLGAHPSYGANESFILQRGAGARLPWNFNVGIRTGVGVQVGSGLRLSTAIDVFNLFNFQGVTAIDQAWTRDSVRPILNSSDLGKLEKQGIVAKVDNQWAKARKNPNFGYPTAFQAPRQFVFSLKAHY